MPSHFHRLTFACFLVLVSNSAGTVLYVDLNSTNATLPYADWSTAATDIQSAIDASNNGDLVLVANGVYKSGGRAVNGYMLTNRVAIIKAVTVQSLNGPAKTTIQGYQTSETTNADSAVRCAYLTNGASLIGFTLTNGATRSSGDTVHELFGGGVWCESTNALISDCVVVANTSADHAGGVYRGSLEDCILMGNHAGLYRYGGGTHSSVLRNCKLMGNWAEAGGGAFMGSLSDCVLNGNRANGGAGAWGAVLTGCILSNNVATLGGGGASSCTLSNCVLVDNSGGDQGGGANSSTLRNCKIISNSVSVVGVGGGVYQSTLENCLLKGNWAGQRGGGTYEGTLRNCVLTFNTARYDSGGGSYYGTLSNCTLTGNWAGSMGGGSYFSWLNNCIVYYNNSSRYPNYYASSRVSYSCTTPDPGGKGNISRDPFLASDSHLSVDSPCRGAGNPASATGVDMDGEPWASPPSMGADEYLPGMDTSPMTVAILATWTNGAVGHPMTFVALIDGETTGSQWSFGDGTVVSNQPYATHTWLARGTFPVVLTAYSQSHPYGLSTTTTVQISGSHNLCVAANATNPIPPYASWETAAANIQDAVDAAAQFGGATVWVTNGLYEVGGRAVFGIMTNRVAVVTPITVRSVNGPEVTTIRGFQLPGTTNGDGAIRCVYLTNGAALVGFSLRDGATLGLRDQVLEMSGGGLWAENTSAVVSNCIFVGNTAAGHGGGAFGATLVNCILSNNAAFADGAIAMGGAAGYCTLTNCLLTKNWAGIAGAANVCDLSNCTLTDNESRSWMGAGGAACYGTLRHCLLARNRSAGSGGATSSANLVGCVLTDNSAWNYGGGADHGTLSNCTIAANSSFGSGGGVYWATARNCIIYYNTAVENPNSYATNLSFCCTFPAAGGAGNITNAPMFIDLDNRDLHLAAESPCINSGNNSYVASSVDLDRNSRVMGGTVDLGAYSSSLSS